MPSTCFHLAFPVQDLNQTKAFYIDGLGCTPGRESPQALILNLYGTQLVAHVTAEAMPPQTGIYPRHFGVVFAELADWQGLADRATAHDLPFYQAPKRRFVGLPLEHRTFFLVDPFGNLLEFKHYQNPEAVFGGQAWGQIGDSNLDRPL
jgi:uncharacterized protein